MTNYKSFISKSSLSLLSDLVNTTQRLTVLYLGWIMMIDLLSGTINYEFIGITLLQGFR